MSEPKYVIRNGDKHIAIVWDTKMGQIINIENKVNFQDGLSIYDVKSGNPVKNVDLLEFLEESLPSKDDMEE